MGSVQKISIALTDKLATDVHAAVASGDYATTSEVVRDALRQWKRARETREAMLADLRAKWLEGLESGDPQPLDVAEIKAAGRRRLAAERVEDEMIIAIPAEPDDPEDRDVSVAGLRHSHMVRDLRALRLRLSLTTETFAARYGISADDYARYESGYVRPPEAVTAYLRVIVAEPEIAARVAARAVPGGAA